MQRLGMYCAVVACALLVAGDAQAFGETVVQRGELQSFNPAGAANLPPNGAPVDGGALLTRTRHSLSLQISTSGLEADKGYTVWWVLFNDPDACAGGAGACGLADLGNPAVGVRLFFAGGFITGADGVANATFNLRAGKIPVLSDPENYRLPGADSIRRNTKGLFPGNGFGVEAHAIVRRHVDLAAAPVGEQIGRFYGGCDVGPGDDCQDQQSVAFPPVN